jgi:hypothetical protein
VSSKKQLRRARQAKEQEEKKRKVNPVWLFLVSIAALVVVAGVVTFFFGADHGPPPWPGAVWSPLHNHWH